MKTIVIDAGHGIETAGKRSPDGTYLEYEFNRDVASKIKAHLERHGLNVILTCPDEHDISLTRRCNISNNFNADLFLSIHSNAFGDGIEWTSPKGWLACIISKGGNAEKLAEKIRSYAIPMLGCVDRGVTVQNYQVLRNTNAPAVLIEHGFHTNIEEVEKLKTQEYRNLCAEIDAKGIVSFLGMEWKKEVHLSTYQCKNGVHVVNIPVENFKILLWDKPKRTTKIKNYANAGFFGSYTDHGTALTLPSANLKADIDNSVAPLSKWEEFYLKEWGTLFKGKVTVECAATKEKGFHGKSVSTLIVKPTEAKIERCAALPNECSYAVSGVPVMVDGQDVSFKNYVVPQGWSTSSLYATWHGFLGVKDGGKTIVYMAFCSKTSNLIASSEAYKKLKCYGCTDIIKLDGGGSFILDVDGKNKAVASGNRQINNVIMF